MILYCTTFNTVTVIEFGPLLTEIFQFEMLLWKVNMKIQNLIHLLCCTYHSLQVVHICCWNMQ